MGGSQRRGRFTLQRWRGGGLGQNGGLAPNALYHWEGCKAFGETNARVALPECRLVSLVEWGYVAPVAALLGSGVAPNIGQGPCAPANIGPAPLVAFG